jgi:hypothetical protein
MKLASFYHKTSFWQKPASFPLLFLSKTQAADELLGLRFW